MFNILKFSFQTPVIVDPDGTNRFDLLGANEFCHESEVSFNSSMDVEPISDAKFSSSQCSKTEESY